MVLSTPMDRFLNRRQIWQLVKFNTPHVRPFIFRFFPISKASQGKGAFWNGEVSSIQKTLLFHKPKKYLGVTKIAQKGRFLGSISVFVQNSKDFLKNLKYFLGYGPIFEKKFAKKGSKRGQNKGFLLFTLFYLILPYFPYFTLFRARSWGAAAGFGILNLGLRAKPRGLKAARRRNGD